MIFCTTNFTWEVEDFAVEAAVFIDNPVFYHFPFLLQTDIWCLLHKIVLVSGPTKLIPVLSMNTSPPPNFEVFDFPGELGSESIQLSITVLMSPIVLQSGMDDSLTTLDGLRRSVFGLWACLA